MKRLIKILMALFIVFFIFGYFPFAIKAYRVRGIMLMQEYKDGKISLKEYTKQTELLAKPQGFLKILLNPKEVFKESD